MVNCLFSTVIVLSPPFPHFPFYDGPGFKSPSPEFPSPQFRTFTRDYLTPPNFLQAPLLSSFSATLLTRFPLQPPSDSMMSHNLLGVPRRICAWLLFSPFFLSELPSEIGGAATKVFLCFRSLNFPLECFVVALPSFFHAMFLAFFCCRLHNRRFDESQRFVLRLMFSFVLCVFLSFPSSVTQLASLADYSSLFRQTAHFPPFGAPAVFFRLSLGFLLLFTQ